MKFFEQFAARAPNRVFLAILLGGASGICYAMLIPLVLKVLAGDDARFQAVEDPLPRFLGLEVAHAPFAAVFAGMCLFILVGRATSQILLTRLAIDVTSELRTRMYDRIARAPLPSLERIGPARMVAALTTDIPRIVNGARLMPDLFINAVTLVGMLGYLLVLSADVLVLVLGGIAFGVLTYQIPMLLGRAHFTRSRHAFDGLQESIQGLIRGVKELKLNDPKREAFFDEVLMTSERGVVRHEKAGHTLVGVGTTYGDLLSFLVIGCVLFVFVNYRQISQSQLVGVVMALLYITGPVALILSYMPQIGLARVAAQRFGALADEIQTESLPAEGVPTRPWDRIRLEQVVYRHPATQDRHFAVGPLDLELRKGEITFIVGGNGSGKSTLSKLITLHYRAAEGRILFGDQEVGDATLTGLRQSVHAIYSDYYLFDRILGQGGDPSLAAQIRYFLDELQLSQAVSYRDGRFSTLSLSDGQRRRMALLVAMLEDKELYLFDEWAADQDPAFKEVFYREVLPALRDSDKVVVVISHDDRYFHVADQLVHMAEGRVVDVRRQHQAPNLAAASPARRWRTQG